MTPVTHKPRWLTYLAVNAAFALSVCVLSAMGASNPRVLHLTLLFALCSSWMIDLDGFNGRFAILALYSSFYFVSFGLVDFLNLLRGTSSEAIPSLYSLTEAVILTGCVMFVGGYRIAVRVQDARMRSAPSLQRDWPMRTALMVGFAIWLVGTLSQFYWGVFIIPDTTIEAAKKGLSSISTYTVTAFLLAGLLQPLGILLLAYVWRTYKLPLMFPLIMAIVVLQVVLGFVLNIKSLAMLGGILVIVAQVLLNGRVPKGWLLGAGLYMVLVYPVFVASREEVHGERHIARTTILENLGHVIELAIAAEQRDARRPEQGQSLLDRTSVRANVQMIVEKAGSEVPYQHGYTLTPLLATFIPRLVWSDKFDVPTGRLVNKAFHLSEYEDTYISPSIPGELYWNFGWAGIVVGMGIIGGITGTLAGRFNLARARNVTGLLVVVITIRYVVVALEGSFAPEYVQWMRSLGAIGLLHVVFARVPVGSHLLSPEHDRGTASPSAQASIQFPNLLR